MKFWSILKENPDISFCQPRRCGICWERRKAPVITGNKDTLMSQMSPVKMLW